MPLAKPERKWRGRINNADAEAEDFEDDLALGDCHAARGIGPNIQPVRNPAPAVGHAETERGRRPILERSFEISHGLRTRPNLEESTAPINTCGYQEQRPSEA
jgi:hypothetical protein